MRQNPQSLITVLIVAGALFAYDHLRKPGRGGSGPSPDTAAMRSRLANIEERLASLVSEVERRAAAASTAATRERAPRDVRLHARPALEISDAALERWSKGIETLRSGRLQDDERKYVERRLRELRIPLSAKEHADATALVLECLAAQAALWRRLQEHPRDPEQADELYEGLIREFHAKLAKAVTDPKRAERIAAALMPLR